MVKRKERTAQLKTHVYDIIAKVVKAVITNSKERGFPVHGAVWAEYGAGKTYAAKQIAAELPEVFYVKIPGDEEVTANRLLRDMLRAMGIGPTRGFQNNLALLERVIIVKGLTSPVFILDEAQRIMGRTRLLNFLKDLSEEPTIGTCYVFLGDPTLKAKLAAGHSIFERVKIRTGVPKISPETVERLMTHYNLEGDAAAVYQICRELTASTLDVDFAFYLFAKQGLNLVEPKAFKVLLQKVKGGEL
jgi:DNA transposition AAA+ family ATPase